MQIFLDIETAPTEDVDTIATIRASIRPPANYKKPETLAAWREAEGEAAALDAIARTALDGGAGQVIAVGLALDDEQPPLVLCRGTSETEADLLRRFFETVARWTAGGAVTDAHGRSIWPCCRLRKSAQIWRHKVATEFGGDVDDQGATRAPWFCWVAEIRTADR